MYPNKRLADVEQILKWKYETLGDVERDLAMTVDPFAKNAIKLRVREEVLPEIRKYEKEYWRLLAQGANLDCYQITEADANNAITEVVQEVDQIEASYNEVYPRDLMLLLLEIRDKLNEPGRPAAAKMKLAVPLIPGVLAYEAELDTEITLKKLFQSVRYLFREENREKKTQA